MKGRMSWFTDRWIYTRWWGGEGGLISRALISGSLRYWFSKTIVNAVIQENNSHLKEGNEWA